MPRVPGRLPGGSHCWGTTMRFILIALLIAPFVAMAYPTVASTGF